MKPRNVFVCVVLALAGCASHLPTEAVCQINMSGWQGSGTLVAVNGDRALVLTCRHVAQSAGTKCVILWPATGEESDGTVLDVIKDTTEFNSDLAFVICRAPQHIQPVIIAKFDPANTPFTCLGYRSKEFYISIARHGTEQDGAIRLSAPLIGGISGGPCLDRNNHLVGVGVGSTETYSLAADGAYLRELVDRYQ